MSLFFGFVFFFSSFSLAEHPSCCCCSVTSRVWLFVTPWTAARQASLSFTISQSLLKQMSSEMGMPSTVSILCSPLSSTLNLSQHQGLFQWISSLHQATKVFETQLQHQSFQYSGLISFRIDRFDLAVQVTLKSLLQHHNSTSTSHNHPFNQKYGMPSMCQMWSPGKNRAKQDNVWTLTYWWRLMFTEGMKQCCAGTYSYVLFNVKLGRYHTLLPNVNQVKEVNMFMKYGNFGFVFIL